MRDSISKNIPAMDGVRGIAAMFVVISHLSLFRLFIPVKGAGQVGVLLFFVLSGFLMSHLYAREDARSLRPWLGYAIRRVLRVYPLYLIILVASYAINEFGYNWLYRMSAEDFWRHVALQGKVSVLWTIPVEMKFYAVFPLIAMGLVRSDKTAVRCLVLGAMIGIFSINPPTGDKLSLLRAITIFLYGMLAAEIYGALSKKRLPERRPAIASALVGLLLGVSFLGLIALIPSVVPALTGEKTIVWEKAYISGAIASAFVLFAALSTGSGSWMLTNRLSRMLGRVSYSLYLIHLPVIRQVAKFDIPSVPVRAILAILLSLLAAAALHYAIERPSQRWGRRLSLAAEEER